MDGKRAAFIKGDSIVLWSPSALPQNLKIPA